VGTAVQNGLGAEESPLQVGGGGNGKGPAAAACAAAAGGHCDTTSAGGLAGAWGLRTAEGLIGRALKYPHHMAVSSAHLAVPTSAGGPWSPAVQTQVAACLLISGPRDSLGAITPPST